MSVVRHGPHRFFLPRKNSNGDCFNFKDEELLGRGDVGWNFKCTPLLEYLPAVIHSKRELGCSLMHRITSRPLRCQKMSSERM